MAGDISPTSKLKASAKPLSDYTHICFFKFDCSKLQANEFLLSLFSVFLFLINMFPFCGGKQSFFLRDGVVQGVVAQTHLVLQGQNEDNTVYFTSKVYTDDIQIRLCGEMSM